MLEAFTKSAAKASRQFRRFFNEKIQAAGSRFFLDRDLLFGEGRASVPACFCNSQARGMRYFEPRLGP
jgi:hypothetical protein